MTSRLSPRDVSIALTLGSVLLGVLNIGLGRRVNYLEHLTAFNSLAAAMLALVSIGFVVSVVSLVRNRGRNGSLWGSAALAAGILATYLLDD
jgi:hypothetical protein